MQADKGNAETMRAAEKYKEALAACPSKGGGVHAWMLGAANHAAAAGIPAEQAAAEIAAAMTRPPSPSSEVRDAVARAYRDRGARPAAGLSAWLPPARPFKPRPAPLSASTFIRRGGDAEEVDLWEASPVRIDWGDDWRLDACALLRALFLPRELVYCGDTYGRTVKARDAWIESFLNGSPIPPFFCVNPFKAEGGETSGGKKSPRCDNAVSTFRHCVAEMDAMPLADQVKFWAGWGLENVAAITFSGSKSLHVIIRVDARDREEWDGEVKRGLYARRLVPLGCDGACVNPARLTRLAGARRADKGGAVQKLLYVREALA